MKYNHINNDTEHIDVATINEYFPIRVTASYSSDISVIFSSLLTYTSLQTQVAFSSDHFSIMVIVEKPNDFMETYVFQNTWMTTFVSYPTPLVTGRVKSSDKLFFWQHGALHRHKTSLLTQLNNANSCSQPSRRKNWAVQRLTSSLMNIATTNG